MVGAKKLGRREVAPLVEPAGGPARGSKRADQRLGQKGVAKPFKLNQERARLFGQGGSRRVQSDRAAESWREGTTKTGHWARLSTPVTTLPLKRW